MSLCTLLSRSPTLGLQAHAATSRLFMCFLGIWTQSLMLPQQAFYPLSKFPNFMLKSFLCACVSGFIAEYGWLSKEKSNNAFKMKSVMPDKMQFHQVLMICLLSGHREECVHQQSSTCLFTLLHFNVALILSRIKLIRVLIHFKTNSWLFFRSLYPGEV